jgi:predicted nucleic acid-binding protein
MIVVDANVIIYLIRETLFTPMAQKLYIADNCWAVPYLWEAEVLNALLMEVRAGTLDIQDAIQASSSAANVLSGNVHGCDKSAVLRTAKDSGLTAYDAYYVTLARSLGIPLITEDKQIKSRCPDVARSLDSYLTSPEKITGIREKPAAYNIKRIRDKK